MGQQETTMAAAGASGGGALKRLILVLLVAAVIVAMVAATSAPAFARVRISSQDLCKAHSQNVEACANAPTSAPPTRD